MISSLYVTISYLLVLQVHHWKDSHNVVSLQVLISLLSGLYLTHSALGILGYELTLK